MELLTGNWKNLALSLKGEKLGNITKNQNRKLFIVNVELTVAKVEFHRLDIQESVHRKKKGPSPSRWIVMLKETSAGWLNLKPLFPFLRQNAVEVIVYEKKLKMVVGLSSAKTRTEQL